MRLGFPELQQVSFAHGDGVVVVVNAQELQEHVRGRFLVGILVADERVFVLDEPSQYVGADVVIAGDLLREQAIGPFLLFPGELGVEVQGVLSIGLAQFRRPFEQVTSHVPVDGDTTFALRVEHAQVVDGVGVVQVSCLLVVPRGLEVFGFEGF